MRSNRRSWKRSRSRGFVILTEIDVQKTSKRMLDVDLKPYQLLGACNPQFSYQALTADEAIGLLLPCNVVLRPDNNGVDVSIQDPEVIFSVVDEETKQAMGGFHKRPRRA